MQQKLRKHELPIEKINVVRFHMIDLDAEKTNISNKNIII